MGQLENKLKIIQCLYNNNYKKESNYHWSIMLSDNSQQSSLRGFRLTAVSAALATITVYHDSGSARCSSLN